MAQPKRVEPGWHAPVHPSTKRLSEFLCAGGLGVGCLGSLVVAGLPVSIPVLGPWKDCWPVLHLYPGDPRVPLTHWPALLLPLAQCPQHPTSSCPSPPHPNAFQVRRPVYLPPPACLPPPTRVSTFPCPRVYLPPPAWDRPSPLPSLSLNRPDGLLCPYPRKL